MYYLILSVVAVFVLCEAADVAKRDEACGELMICMVSLDSFEASNVESISALSHIEQYDQICQANTDFQSCYADKKDGCDDPTVLNMISGPEQVLDYICSEEGKEELEKIADSSCVTDQSTLLAAQESVGECVENFQLEYQMALYSALSAGEDAQSIDLCSFIDQLSNCIMASLNNHCGDDFGSFAKKIWDIAFKPVAGQMGCDKHVRQIRHLRTRIFPLIIAAAKKIR